MFNKQQSTNYKAMTRLELEQAYNITYRTLRTWLRSVPELKSRYKQIFNPKEVKMIFDHLGKPDDLEEF